MLKSLFRSPAAKRRFRAMPKVPWWRIGLARRRKSVSDWGVNVTTRKKGATTQTGVIVFSIMRNEHHFLPFFLDHYRELGVGEFHIFADRCDPQTIDFLFSQPDVTILESERAFGEVFGKKFNGYPRRLPSLLKEKLTDELFLGRWVLVVDADEFLILPPPLKQINALTDRLERSGQYFSYAPLVDFYPPRLAIRNYDPGFSPFRFNEYFDTGPYHRWDGKVTPFKFHRGFRSRLMKMMAERFPGELKAIYGTHPISPPNDYKFPLIKQGAGLMRGGSHNVIGVKPSSRYSTSLAHFKLHPGLDEKIENALREKQYYQGSLEYEFLKLAIDKTADDSLVFEGSRRFTGAQSLVDADLLQELD